MIEQLATETGHILSVGRIHRGEIDRFAAVNAPPEPPLRTAAEMGIEVFGGIEDEEYIADLKDETYLEAAGTYILSFWNARLEHIAPAIELVSDLTESDLEEIAALEEIGKTLDHVGILRFIIFKSEQDAARAVISVQYNSTVTIQGINEAAQRYRVKWAGEPISTDVSESPLWTAREFSDRRTARYCGYNWPDFCQLAGPEQSSLAAFHRLNVRIDNISARAFRPTRKGARKR